MNARINEFGLTKKVEKAEFVNLISSFWHIGTKERNVLAGLETTGIWPLNKEKYDKSILTFVFLKSIRNWWSLENQN